MVQRMLERHAFFSETQKEVLVSKGEHRRHIISHHLMMSALQAWYDTHKGVMKIGKLQELLDQMNNYAPNLHPGNGAVNTAIGMFTNNASKKISSYGSKNSGLSSSDFSKGLGETLGKYGGFQQGTQHQLLDPILPVFNDSNINFSQESSLVFANDLVDSTDFDWPSGAKKEHFKAWEAAYNLFLSLRNNAQHFDLSGLQVVIKTFLSLPDPTV